MNRQGSEIPWWAIALGFMIAPPVGVVLLILSLNGVRIPTNKAQQAFRDIPLEVNWESSAQRRAAKKAAKKAKKQAQLKDGSLLIILGAILSFIFGLGFLEEFITGLHYGLFFNASAWIGSLGFFCASLFTFYTGLKRNKLSKRQRLYMGVIGTRKSVFLSDLASAAGVSEKTAMADIQAMLADGTLPMGYIDRASGRLVLTNEGYEPQQTRTETAKEAPQKEEDADDAILKEIRAINDAIPGEEMSRKIDRIEEITRRILAYQRQNPAKADQLRQFLNYYLPTTLRLLRTYAQLDAQGINGENITASKKRIEGMMDKVVEGFEKQLDQLFQTDAMDVATDVEVLERMLEKDGLGSGGMTMTGSSGIR